VFLSAPITSLENTTVRLQSPTGTSVILLGPGDAVGRDLLTIFSDIATTTWGTGYAPYHTGVRPSEPLSAFDGENPFGLWFLMLEATSGGRVSVWTWGIRINSARVDVPLDGPDAARGLRFVAANPARSAGRVAFELAKAGSVDLALYDLQGRRVLPILEGERAAGSYVMSFPTSVLAPGVYVVRLNVGGAAPQQLKLTVTK
jgi:hypothetical protein